MNAERVVYLDSSALVRLIVREAESEALRRFLGRRPRRASCALARVEVIRAVRPQGRAAVERARLLLGRVDLVRLDDALLDAAGDLELPAVRSLDAIHLAAAQSLSDELDAVVTYDDRMAQATRRLGLSLARPATATARR